MTKQSSYWNSLRARLNCTLSGYGAKSALAREFHVTPASVSEWLSGESSPTAETALRLLHWVEARETKPNKNPGRASTRPGPKTRVRKSSYEKQAQVRKKQ